MPKEVKRSELIHIQVNKDNRCVDLLLTAKELEKAAARAIDIKNANLIPHDCCNCWPIEKPPSCTFWDRVLFKCPTD